MIAVHVAELLFAPPRRLPDIYPVLNVLVCTPIFAVTWLWSIKRSIEVAWGTSRMNVRLKSQKRD